jgi:fructose-1,6-bisphosphatase/inositol monophosphatase family enzyme
MRTSDYQLELAVATDIAKQAGTIMLQYFDTDQQRKIKHDGSLVTIADTTINELALNRLGAAFPGDGMVGEEGSTKDTSQQRLWFCDPIDGTKAYVWGVPTAMFSLGLIVGNEPVLGVAYDPFLQRLYTAVQGHGSFCNGRRLHVNDDDLKSGIVAVTSSIEDVARQTPPVVTGLLDAKARLATFSGAVYKGTLVARGRMVAYIENWTNPHDIAAIHTIVTEAGGRVTAPDGGPLNYRKGFRGALLSNGRVHEQIVSFAQGEGK